MAMNSRQRAMTSLLGEYVRRREDWDDIEPERAPLSNVVRATAAEALAFLKAVVNAVEKGELVLNAMSMESFQQPDFSDMRTIDGLYSRPLVANNRTASVKFELIPTGLAMNLDGDGEQASNPDDDDYPDERVLSDTPRPAKRGAPAAPAGASAAREIIFDDDGDDPT